MTKPHFEKTNLNQYQLIILTQIAETRYSFGELHYPLDAGRDIGGELLPQPAPLVLHGLGRRRGRLAVRRTGRRHNHRLSHQTACVLLGVAAVGVVCLRYGEDYIVHGQLLCFGVGLVGVRGGDAR